MTMKKLIFIPLILAFLGFLDATYLTIIHYKNIVPPCSIAHGCETVLLSKFATIGPIPIALIGSLFYLTIMVLLGIYLQLGGSYSSSEQSESRSSNINSSRQARTILNLIFLLSLISIVISFVLVYIQAGILHAFCQYCLTSEGINVLLFMFILKLNFFSANKQS